MRPEVETVADFVADWLALRSREPEAGPAAARLIGPLPTLLDPRAEAAGRFLDLLDSRLRGLALLARRAGPGAPPGSPLARWSEMARQVAAGWHADDPGSWWGDLLELSAGGNGLLRASITACLADAVDPARRARPVASALARLREVDEAPYRRITVPPAPSAPWDAEGYLIPPDDSAIFAALRPATGTRAVDEGPADGPPSWEELADAHAAGWPVPFDELARALRDLRARRPDLPPDAVDAALAAWGRSAGPPTAGPEPVPTPEADPVAELAGRLESGGSSEEQAFGKRLREAGAQPTPDRARRLVGCLISMDELAEGEGRGWDWLRPARDRLLEVARGLEGCLVLDRDLLGQPVRQVGEQVVAVGLDDGSPAGSRNRITHVDRPGYALLLPDGGRQVVARARVRIGS